MGEEIGVGGFPVDGDASVWVNEDIKEWYNYIWIRMFEGAIQIRC